MFAGQIGLVNLQGILFLDPLLAIPDSGLAKISGLFNIFLYITVSQFVADLTYTRRHIYVGGLYKKSISYYIKGSTE